MKKTKLLLFAFAMMAMFPFYVNAETSNDYNVEIKDLEDYVCEELKGHNLDIIMQGYNEIVVSDETTNKQYLIDFTNIGVCEEYVFQGYDDEDYVPIEYSWDGNKLYLETYSSDYLIVHTKTLDEEIESNSSYSELKQNGFHHVDNPSDENIENYYEVYYFTLATGVYDENANYYEIKQYPYSTDEDGSGYYELATTIELTESNYEPNKYYVIAPPIKKELIEQFSSDTFNVPKDKTNLNEDLSLSKIDFNHHFEFGNKKYYVFRMPEELSIYHAIFDEERNYQTFGFDNFLPINIFRTDDNQYLSFLAKTDNINYISLLDENINMMALYDMSQYGDDILLLGHNENKFYYLFYHDEHKFLEIDYFGSTDKHTVTLDANGGKFGNQTTHVINNWENELYDSLITPTREGYTFKGYYTEKTGGTKFEMILNESGIDSDMTFYAQWKLNQENPQTLDNLTNSILIGTISLIGLIGAAIYLKRKNKVKA